MSRLLAFTVLIALFSYGADSFRVLREVPEAEENSGPLHTVTNTLWSFFGDSVDTAERWLKTIHQLPLVEKARNMYYESTEALSTYGGIMKDQMYFLFQKSE